MSDLAIRFLLREHTARAKLVFLGSVTLMCVLLAWFALVGAGASYTVIWLNDVMALTSAAYRTYYGQVPSIDFQSVLGVGVLYPSAVGVALGLNGSVILAFGQVAVAAVLLPAAVLISRQRFSLVPGMILVVFLALLIVAPISLGGAPGDITFGVFYNKHGWAALAIVLLCYVEPRAIRRGTLWQDVAAVYVAILFLLHTTINFAAVALGFMVANAIVSPYNRRLAICSVGALAATVVLLELFTAYPSAYVRDIAEVSSATLDSGTSKWQLIVNAWSTWPSLAACLMALIALRVTGRKRLLDSGFFAGALAVAAVLTMQTRSGAVAVPALVAVIACFGELARRTVGAQRRTGDDNWRAYGASLAILGFMALFVSQPIAASTFAVYKYYRETTGGSAVARSDLPPSLEGFLVEPEPFQSLHDLLGHEDVDHAFLAELRRATDVPQSTAAYLDAIIEGAGLVQANVGSAEPIVVFDCCNPFDMPLRLRPTEYGYPFFWRRAAFSRTSHPPPERFFSDAVYAMVPLVPRDQHQFDAMWDVYGTYLEEHFERVARTPHWELWSRRTR